jgi:DNA-binding CsgD family transcriptional regulator/tetratricopeptide (TPR) repeat protein
MRELQYFNFLKGIMRNKYFFFLIVVFFFFSCNKEHKSIQKYGNVIDYKDLKRKKDLNIDSLYKVSSLRKKDTTKVNEFITIYRLSIRNKPIRDDILDEAFKISKILEYHTGMANCLNRKGLNYRYEHKYLEAVNFHKEALEHYEKSWNKNCHITNLNNLGVSYRRLNLEEYALKYYLIALDLAAKSNNPRSQAISLNGIGNIYINLGKYDEAITYFELALNLEKINKNSKGMGYDYSNLGEAYMHKEMYDKSYSYHLKSLEIAKEINYKDNEAIVYNTIGQMFQLRGDYAESLKYFKKAVPLLKKFNSKRYLSNTKINIGIDQTRLKSYKEAEANIIEGLKLATKIHTKENIILGQKALSDLYKLTENYNKSLHHHELMTIYKDSVFNIQSENNINAMNIKYESEKKDEKIKRLHLENKVQNHRMVILFLLTGLLFVIGVFSVFYNRIRIKNQNLELDDMRQNIEKYLGQISELEREKQVSILVDNQTNENEVDEYGLTSKEKEVLGYIAKGMKNKQIAETMFVSDNTVKTHIKNIYLKLDVKNRVEATMLIRNNNEF